MLQQPLRVEIIEIFGKGGGGNLIWGDLAFYGGGGTLETTVLKTLFHMAHPNLLYGKIFRFLFFI